MAETFGATVDDVKAYLPHLELGEEVSEEGAERQPSEADVERFLERAGAWVAQRTGAIDPETHENAYAMAATLTVIGAASWTDAAAFPERAQVSDTSYAGTLWAQFLKGLDELLESLGIGTEGGASGAAGPKDLPDAYFPPPIFVRNRTTGTGGW
jgi:hypothetical protein